MKKNTTQKGISIIEVLVALGVFALSFSAIIFLLLDATRSSGYDIVRTQAAFLAQEGVEASRSIAGDHFDDLVLGTHGLALSGGVWTLSDDHDTTDIFTRHVTVTNAGSGVKDIVSEVTWDDSSTRHNAVRFVGRISAWRE